MAQNYKLAETEARFADILWEHEPVASMQLVKLCEERLSWKKSTTFTVLKKLCDRGIFQNVKAVVSARISREEFYAGKSREFVDEAFGGSLPKFLAAFIGKSRLSSKQVEEMKSLIESYREDE